MPSAANGVDSYEGVITELGPGLDAGVVRIGREHNVKQQQLQQQAMANQRRGGQADSRDDTRRTEARAAYQFSCGGNREA